MTSFHDIAARTLNGLWIALLALGLIFSRSCRVLGYLLDTREPRWPYD